MTAQRKLVVAFLGVVLLLLNPAGVCEGSPAAQSPSHPCCPAPPANSHSGGAGTCVCIDRQPAAPTVPSLDSGQAAPMAATDTAAPLSANGSETAIAPDGIGFTTDARFITFHQILV